LILDYAQEIAEIAEKLRLNAGLSRIPPVRSPTGTVPRLSPGERHRRRQRQRNVPLGSLWVASACRGASAAGIARAEGTPNRPWWPGAVSNASPPAVMGLNIPAN